MHPVIITFFSTALWIIYIIAIIFGIINASNEEEPELSVIGDLAKNRK